MSRHSNSHILPTQQMRAMSTCFGLSQGDLESEYPQQLYSCNYLLVGVLCLKSCSRFCIIFWFHHIYYPCTTLVLPSSSSITQIRGHIAGPPTPSPPRYMPSFLSREDSAFSSLVRSRRIVLTHAARCSQQLVVLFLAFLQIKSNPTTVGIELKDQG